MKMSLLRLWEWRKTLLYIFFFIYLRCLHHIHIHHYYGMVLCIFFTEMTSFQPIGLNNKSSRKCLEFLTWRTTTRIFEVCSREKSRGTLSKLARKIPDRQSDKRTKKELKNTVRAPRLGIEPSLLYKTSASRTNFNRQVAISWDERFIFASMH